MRASQSLIPLPLIGILTLALLIGILAWAKFDPLYSMLLREPAPQIPSYPGQRQVVMSTVDQDDVVIHRTVFMTIDSPTQIQQFYSTHLGPPARWVSDREGNPRTWEYDPDYCPWSTLSVGTTETPERESQVQVDLVQRTCRPFK